MQKSQFHGAFALNRRVDLHAMSTYRRRAQEAPRQRRRHRRPVWGRRRRAAAEAEARRAARARRRAAAVRAFGGQEGEGRSLGGRRGRGGDARLPSTDDRLPQGKIDELVNLRRGRARREPRRGGGGRGRLRRGRPPRGRGARRGRLAQGQQHQVPDEPVGGWGFVSFKEDISYSCARASGL